jgi:flavin-binding protein dodecin
MGTRLEEEYVGREPPRSTHTTHVPRKEADVDGSGVYRFTEVIGTSAESWEDAAKNAVGTAAKTLRDLRIGEVSKLDMTIEAGT